jgi:hypothetical protein
MYHHTTNNQTIIKPPLSLNDHHIEPSYHQTTTTTKAQLSLNYHQHQILVKKPLPNTPNHYYHQNCATTKSPTPI